LFEAPAQDGSNRSRGDKAHAARIEKGLRQHAIVALRMAIWPRDRLRYRISFSTSRCSIANPAFTV
jgi:hypothetical protein